MFCSAARPMVPGLMRTPSTSTSVWLLSAPRMNTAVVWPGPPLRPRSRPGVEAQQLGDVGGGAALDGVAIDDDHGREHFVDRRRDARGGDHDVVGRRDSAAAAAARRGRHARRRTEAGSNDASMQSPRARPLGCSCRVHGRGAAGRRTERGTRPLARREAGLVRQAGLRALEWTSRGPARIPFPRSLRSGCRRCIRPMQARLDYRCGGSAGVRPASRSPAHRAGSPDGARTVGKGAGGVKHRAGAVG